MFKTEKRHTIDILFVITLFAVFALSVLSLTGVGARVYDSIVEKMSDNYESRTAFSYVVNKVHQNDADGAITIGTYGGCKALILTEEIDNVSYSTYLYYYDGAIKELYTRAGQEFDPTYGTDIMDVDGFEVSKVTDSLLKFEITPSGGETEVLFCHLRSED